MLLLLLSTLLAEDSIETAATRILEKNCLQCHGAQSKMGGLILESREAALKGGVGGPALVPGNAAQSLLARKVNEGKMPVGTPLPAADRQLIARWIDQGAPWTNKLAVAERKRAGKDWWSLQPLKPPPNASIDSVLNAALTAKGLRMSAEADRRTLIRRATFDLTGLPPTPEAVAAFVADPASNAYEKLIDELLASPGYGERWGRHWMDVIRFGESHGYEQNHLRPNAWHFRDYIIRSFNDGKPFDRFLQEHLAADVLSADPKEAVGTGFLVAGPHDTVGNAAEAPKRQQRADDLDDMINATASAFLGLTVSCARCHDHKFDPILQADYYRMAAIFGGVIHAERELATPAGLAAHRARTAPLETEIREITEKLAAARETAKPRVESRREAILAQYRAAPESRLTEESWPAAPARFVRLRIQATSTGGATSLEEFEVWSGGRNVALASDGARITATSVRKEDGSTDPYSEKHLIDGRFDQRWIPADSKPVTLTVELPRAIEVTRAAWSRDRAGGFQGRFSGPIPSEYIVEISLDGSAWRQVASSEGRLPVTDAQREELVLMAVFSEREKQTYREAQQRLAAARRALNELPKLTMAYAGKFEQPTEPVYLLKRGNVMDRGDVAAAASLTTLDRVLPAFDVPANEPESKRRLALAQWITDPKNPLTPRVLANRVWHYHFGRGIVGTPSDFGFSGERPSHPELLDHLAARLLAHGWRLKPLHKEIMLSKAYRQSSANNEAAAKADGEARLLWRFPPQRLEAEAIRDTILAVSGTLDRTMGGPGFHLFRYTVDNVATYYPLETFGPETYRRAVYQQAARSVRSEMLGQYDCPDSSLPEPKRVVTTSPLQALALLNNSFLLDQSAFFAGRLEREAGDPVRRAFQLAFSRDPEPAEQTAARNLIARHGLKAFARAILNANELIYVQ